MKIHFFSGEAGLKNSLLLSLLLLSACTSNPQVDGAVEPVRRPSAAAPQTAAPQKSAPVEVQQPAPSSQGNLPKKSKHNVEED